MTSVEPERDVFEGAGIVSSYADLADAVGEQDAGGVLAAGTAAGLDTLGVAMDPLGSLSAAGVGWAIEHVSFLREPLDAMLGDPPVIEARAQAWHLFSRELGAQADEFEATVARETAGWVGEAADAYRVAAGRLRDALASTAADADRVAGTVLDSAAMVGTVRSLVRDMIADWVGRLVAWLLATVVSAGLALAAAVPSMVLEATTLALRAADTLSTLVRDLDEAAAALASVVARMGRTADEVAAAAAHVPAWSGDTVSPAAERGGPLQAAGDSLRLTAAVESGKQGGQARAEREEWAEESARER